MMFHRLKGQTFSWGQMTNILLQSQLNSVNIAGVVGVPRSYSVRCGRSECECQPTLCAIYHQTPRHIQPCLSGIRGSLAGLFRKSLLLICCYMGPLRSGFPLGLQMGHNQNPDHNQSLVTSRLVRDTPSHKWVRPPS